MFTGEIDLSDVDSMLGDMEKRAVDPDRFLQSQKAPVMRDHRGYAKAEKSPDGEPWAKRKSGKRGKALGKLPKLVRARVMRGEMVVDLPSAVAHIGNAHQSGARVGRGVTLPARQFVGTTDERAEKLAEDYAVYVATGELK